MALRQNNAEGLPHGTTIAASQAGSGDAFMAIATSGVGSMTAIYSNARSAHGTQSYRMTTSGDAGFSMRWHSSTPSAAGRCYVYFEALPVGSGLALLDARNLTGGAVVATIAVVSGRFVVQDNSGQIHMFPTFIVAGQWYRLELLAALGATGTTGSISAAYYLLDSTSPVDTPFSTNTASIPLSNIYQMWVGKRNTSPSVDMFMDDIAWETGASAFIGPVPPPKLLNNLRLGSHEPGKLYYDGQPVNRMYYGSTLVIGETED